MSGGVVCAGVVCEGVVSASVVSIGEVLSSEMGVVTLGEGVVSIGAVVFIRLGGCSSPTQPTSVSAVTHSDSIHNIFIADLMVFSVEVFIIACGAFCCFMRECVAVP